MGMFQLIKAGGITIYALVLYSVLSIAIIMERLIYYHSRSKVNREDFMVDIKNQLERDNLRHAITMCTGMCRDADTPFANVVSAGLNAFGRGEKEISSNMERSIVVQTNMLSRFTTTVGTISSTAVYIGLLGTVIGIMKAFHSISATGAGGISVVINGISEALISTAAGLLVAVPAVMAYNYFMKRIDGFITDMELCASETLDLLSGKHK
ncbi:MAG: flagellar motor protein MotA [Candidatus Omnitrophica bacterium CG22_combo_CG10-13_8_21_14_all_43_16]|nr:MAG: flagellar motor protein MotA [Candidatus Omnitrophica bacterium CG22_combo_CG10-13_8_21_14_all_43_16]